MPTQREPEPVMMHGLPGNLKNFAMRDSFARMVPKPAPEPKPCILKSTEPEKPEKNYGADISTFIHMIKNGGAMNSFQSRTSDTLCSYDPFYIKGHIRM